MVGKAQLPWPGSHWVTSRDQEGHPRALCCSTSAELAPSVLPESQHTLCLAPAVHWPSSPGASGYSALCNAFPVLLSHDPPLPSTLWVSPCLSSGPGLWASSLLFPLSRATFSLTPHHLEPPQATLHECLGSSSFFRAVTGTCYSSSASFVTTYLPQEHEAECPSQGTGICFAHCYTYPQGPVPKGLSRPVSQAGEEKNPL